MRMRLGVRVLLKKETSESWRLNLKRSIRNEYAKSNERLRGGSITNIMRIAQEWLVMKKVIEKEGLKSIV